MNSSVLASSRMRIPDSCVRKSGSRSWELNSIGISWLGSRRSNNCRCRSTYREQFPNSSTIISTCRSRVLHSTGWSRYWSRMPDNSVWKPRSRSEILHSSTWHRYGPWSWLGDISPTHGEFLVHWWSYIILFKLLSSIWGQVHITFIEI